MFAATWMMQVDGCGMRRLRRVMEGLPVVGGGIERPKLDQFIGVGDDDAPHHGQLLVPNRAIDHRVAEQRAHMFFMLGHGGGGQGIGFSFGAFGDAAGGAIGVLQQKDHPDAVFQHGDLQRFDDVGPHGAERIGDIVDEFEVAEDAAQVEFAIHAAHDGDIGGGDGRFGLLRRAPVVVEDVVDDLRRRWIVQSMQGQRFRALADQQRKIVKLVTEPPGGHFQCADPSNVHPRPNPDAEQGRTSFLPGR